MRILIADDNLDLLRRAIEFIQQDHEVVGTAREGLELVRAAMFLKPDLIVTDVSLPRMGGIQAVREILEALPACRVIFLSMHMERDLVADALAAGALGYVSKLTADTDLPLAVQEALQGRTFVSPSVALP